MKTLVVYYSRTGNTGFVAEKIAQELGADLEEVVDLKKRFGMSAFMKASLDAMLGRETKISATAKSPDLYDLIVVGTPVWFTRPTPAIRTYLKQNSLAGKRVAVFCTNDGSGAEKAVEKTKELLPNSTLAEHLVVTKLRDNKAEAENKISMWCSKLKAQ
jgi:flavodoxin